MVLRRYRVFEFDYNKYWLETERLIELHGVPFTVIALNDEQKEDFAKLDSAAMILKASDNGLSINNVRIIDDEAMAKRLPDFWAKMVSLDEGMDPALQHQLAEEVIELSGLTEIYEAQYTKEIEEAEEAARLAKETENAIDGDAKTPDFNSDMHEVAEAAAHPANA